MDKSQQPATALSATRKRALRGIAHHLHPVVTVGNDGLTPGVIGETDRALTDHELIKVKVHGEDKAARRQLVDQLVNDTGALLVQQIGHVAVLYKENPKANEKLSNVRRYG